MGRRRALGFGMAALAVLAAAGIALALALRPRAPARLKAEARGAAMAGRYDEARGLVTRWLGIEPGSAEAHYLKARVGLALDRPGEVAEGMDRAEALGYPASALDLLRSVIAAKQKRYGEAGPALERASDENHAPDPLRDEALAKVYIETFQFDRAGPVLDRWMRAAPGQAKPYLWRVEVDKRREAGPEAIIRDYREALRRDPALVDARLGLANQLRAAHRCDEAAPEYDAYLAARPDDPIGHLGAGRNALERGDEAVAARHLDRALALDPGNAQAHRERGAIDLRRGDVAGALAHLDRAARDEPDDLEIRYDRALALARPGRDAEAKAERAVVARLRADQVEMDRLLRRLVQQPHDAALQCRAARWLFDHGHPDEAVRWAETALRDHPGEPEACRLLAEHYRRAGNPGLADFYRLEAAGATTP